MRPHRILVGSLLAIAAALPLLPQSADARVFFGVGIGFPVFGFGAPFYYPPPAYYYPPPVVYAPPPVAYGAPAVLARCTTGGIVCPLPYTKPVGAACSCPDNAGRYVPGRVG
jgi:hypothetical protein